MLKISNNLSLRREAVTQTMVIYGGKGMGKTNLLTVLAEELSAARQRFSIIDPMGVFWGLRHSADGRGRGIEVLILGGRHGDIPIEPTGGAVVADLVVDENVNVVVDIHSGRDGKTWSRGARIRFVTDYFVRLYERQGEKRRPILQILDEAARFAPQQMTAGDKEIAACLGAVNQVVEEGRNVGIGIAFAAQRSARLNKSVAELADCMIAFRTIGPNSITAITDWLGEHVAKERWKEIVEQLRALPRGHALVISPGWLQHEGIVEIRRRHTLDTSGTPEGGREARASGEGAKPDLARYQERMAETIERAKADDPRELRRRITELERQVKKPAATAPAPAAKEKRVEVPVLKDTQLKRLEAMVEKLVTGGSSMLTFGKQISDALYRIRAEPKPRTMTAGAGAATMETPGSLHHSTRNPLHGTDPRLVYETHSKRETNGTSAGESGLRRMLVALAQRPQGLSAKQLGVRAGLSSSSGTFGTYLGKGRSAGWIEGSRDKLRITDAGIQALGSYEPLPEGRDLLNYWMAELGGGAARMLQVLVESGRSMTADELGQAAGLSADSGTFGTYLGKLRTLELVTGSRQDLRASEELG